MLHHRYAVNNAGSSARGLKFSESCGEKGGWYWKPKHFVVVDDNFSISSVFKEKINFWKYWVGVQSFWRLFWKRKAARQTTPQKVFPLKSLSRGAYKRYPRFTCSVPQIDSMLPSFCSVTDHRLLQNENSFMNHTRLSVKFTCHIWILALSHVMYKPFAAAPPLPPNSVWTERINTSIWATAHLPLS